MVVVFPRLGVQQALVAAAADVCSSPGTTVGTWSSLPAAVSASLASESLVGVRITHPGLHTGITPGIIPPVVLR